MQLKHWYVRFDTVREMLCLIVVTGTPVICIPASLMQSGDFDLASQLDL